jgi:hypothetical protein
MCEDRYRVVRTLILRHRMGYLLVFIFFPCSFLASDLRSIIISVQCYLHVVDYIVTLFNLVRDAKDIRSFSGEYGEIIFNILLSDGTAPVTLKLVNLK